jgi:hypothetical protein
MKTKTVLSREAFLAKVAALWPALKGSLSQVRKPCIRPGCPACARGQKHLAYLLSFTQDGCRRCMYVPDALAPLIDRGLRNGRSVEQLLCDMGPTLIRDHRQKRALATDDRPKPAKSGTSNKKRRAKN